MVYVKMKFHLGRSLGMTYFFISVFVCFATYNVTTACLYFLKLVKGKITLRMRQTKKNTMLHY